MLSGGRRGEWGAGPRSGELAGTWRLKLPPLCPLISEQGRTWTPGPAGGGKRAAARHLGALCAALWAPAGAGDVRADRGQCGHVQLHRTAGRCGARLLALQGESQEEPRKSVGRWRGRERGGDLCTGNDPVPGSPFPQHVFPFSLIRYDVTTGEPIRDTQGHCVATSPGLCPGGVGGGGVLGEWGGRRPPLTPVALAGEPGLLVAPVSQQSPFLGYAGGPELAQGKLLKDVFQPGDVFFNTGDLLVCDNQGFLRFHDRTGDTFRYLPLTF